MTPSSTISYTSRLGGSILTALALAAAVTLSACGQPATPPGSTTPAPSASPSPSPTPTPLPTVPPDPNRLVGEVIGASETKSYGLGTISTGTSRMSADAVTRSDGRSFTIGADKIDAIQLLVNLSPSALKNARVSVHLLDRFNRILATEPAHELPPVIPPGEFFRFTFSSITVEDVADIAWTLYEGPHEVPSIPFKDWANDHAAELPAMEQQARDLRLNGDTVTADRINALTDLMRPLVIDAITTVYLTAHQYHLEGCRGLARGADAALTLREARATPGLHACSSCALNLPPPAL